MVSKGQRQRNTIFKVVNRKACPRIFKYHQIFEIINYLNQEESLNKQSELISKCHHINKYLLSNYKSNDLLISKIPTEHYQFVIKFKIIRYGNVSHIKIFSVK